MGQSLPTRRYRGKNGDTYTTRTALRSKIRARMGDPFHHMFRFDRKGRHVVEMPIKGLRNHRQKEPIDTTIGLSVMLDGIIVYSAVCLADRKGVGKDDWGV